MVLHLVFVAAHLPVELVHQLIDGGVKVFMALLDKDVFALDVHSDFGLLPSFLLLQFLYRQQHGDVHDLVEMAGDPLQFCEYILSQGWRHFKVVAADRQVHEDSFRRGWGSGTLRLTGCLHDRLRISVRLFTGTDKVSISDKAPLRLRRFWRPCGQLGGGPKNGSAMQ